MIIGHIAYDKPGLLACCLTCRSWYLAAAPRLHHTIIASNTAKDVKSWWHVPFWDMHKLGLFPLVKRFQVQGSCDNYEYGPTTLSPNSFDRHILHQFSSLTNVQQLGIDDLDLPSFMPNLRRYFNHFLPTVRSLALRSPRGSSRQIIFFIGLFQHLEDLELLSIFSKFHEETPDCLTLVPPFTPPIRGRLTIRRFNWASILKDMIVLFGGFRFRYVEFRRAEGIQLVLDACVETLETLWFDPMELQGEKASLKTVRLVQNQNFSVRSFDLSQNKSLRELKVTDWDISNAVHLPQEDPTPNLKHVLSTVTSPVFCEFTICYSTSDFPGNFRYNPSAPPTFLSYRPYDHRREEYASNHKVFDTMRELRRVRDFRLVLCADVWGALTERATRELEWIIQVGWVGEGSDATSSWPLVTYSPREFFPAPGETSYGVTHFPWAHPWAPCHTSSFSIFPGTKVKKM
jgi:hypothetical protein